MGECSLHSRVDYYAEAWGVSKDGVHCDRKKRVLMRNGVVQLYLEHVGGMLYIPVISNHTNSPSTCKQTGS